MSDFITDILNHKEKLSMPSENKDQSISRVMKEKYDFEKYLFDSNNGFDDSSTNDKELKDYVDNENEYIHQNGFIQGDFISLSECKNVLHLANRINNVRDVSAVPIAKDVKGVVSKYFDQSYVYATSVTKKDGLDLNVLTKDKTEFFRVAHRNTIITEDENVRLVKSGTGYKLYLNIDDSGLTESKIISLLKFIESDKNICINKVVLNRELIFDKKYKQELEHETSSKDNSKINIKI